ncbi:MAG: tetratricopeptide repeat protein [Saprospiraceae bacterium]
MKKNLFTLVLLALSAVAVQAQEGAKLAKQASKALVSYEMDQANNAAKLDEAKTLINDALKNPDAQALASAWISKGQIYNTILQRDLARKMVDPKATMSGDNDALEAYNAFVKGNELATKKYEKADAIKGISEVQASLINVGIAKYDLSDYEKALASFEATLQSHDVLKAAGQKSILDADTTYDNQVFTTAITATLAKNCTKALEYYTQLYKKGSNKPAIYDGMYTCLNEQGKTEEAKKILAEGRAKFPDDSGLLFSEINVYLKEGRLDELTSQLKQAIKQEPTNIGLYVTLGNVYDNLYTRELKAKNDVKANEYFEEAKKQYEAAIAIDPKNADAQYSMGTLYYNRAALRSEELNALPDDYSAAGIKKYEKIKNDMMKQFDLALPFFQKAESLDPNDKNTLIALSEIYARKEDPLASEFKKRLDTLNAGKKNATSYFSR